VFLMVVEFFSGFALELVNVWRENTKKKTKFIKIFSIEKNF